MKDFRERIKEWKAQRSATQMTLGKFISELESLPQDEQIENLCSPHSYRGYYSDLAFERGRGTRSVGGLLYQLKNDCLGKTFIGYKGGENHMDENTPLWIANYGSCGVKIMDIVERQETFMLSTEGDD